MARGLTIKRFGLINVNYRNIGAHRLRVEVTDPCNTGADVAVFMFLRLPPNPANGAELDEFHAVASPVDMSEYPAEAPDSRTAFPFYRSSAVELDFRSTALADYAWTTMVAEIGELLAALDRLDHLVVTETVTVGDCPETGDSDSDSDSTGSSSSV